jgi:hypothetical protein
MNFNLINQKNRNHGSLCLTSLQKKLFKLFKNEMNEENLKTLIYLCVL